MQMFTPNSTIIGCSVPLTMGDRKQVDFSSLTAQHDYFFGLRKLTWDNYNYQRKDHSIVVSGNVDSLSAVNYVMYRNANFTQADGNYKWFYAFVTAREWVSENAARLYLKTDVFQTWLFDMDLHPSMVVREHTPTDGYYEHTLAENLELGEPIEINRIRATTYSMSGVTAASFDANYRCVVCCSELWRANIRPTSLLGGLPRAAYYYGFSRAQLPYAIADMVDTNGAESIICVYAVPIGALNWEEYNVDGFTYYVPSDKADPDTREILIPPRAEPYRMGTIKNKKCFSYPYHYYVLHDYAGHSVTLAPQNFLDANQGSFKVKTYFNGATNPAALTVPLNYLNMGIAAQSEGDASIDYSVCYDSFPELAYSTDFFKNYLALNSAKLSVNSAAIAMQAMFSTTHGLSEALSGLNPVVSTAANLVDMQKVPDRVNGNIGGNLHLKAGNAGIYISEYRLKDEYMSFIDRYFTMYGYKVMTMKLPQFNTRKLFNYIQTSGIDLSGQGNVSIPQTDLDELASMFNQGLTVWHISKGATFGSYSGDNSPG